MVHVGKFFQRTRIGFITLLVIGLSQFAGAQTYIYVAPNGIGQDASGTNGTQASPITFNRLQARLDAT
ncbi:MAG: hypothetical protein LBD28_06790, partial [Tannerellaceae bacterium]|nr:hypothetical protein [Tannerellaceae bacterium]